MFAANTGKSKPQSPTQGRDARQVFAVSLRRASRELGYTPGHLSRVIKGERISPPTLRAYLDLVKREGFPEGKIFL